MSNFKIPLVPPETKEKTSDRQWWLSELTDYTPQQIDAILAQLEKQQPAAS